MHMQVKANQHMQSWLKEGGEGHGSAASNIARRLFVNASHFSVTCSARSLTSSTRFTKTSTRQHDVRLRNTFAHLRLRNAGRVVQRSRFGLQFLSNVRAAAAVAVQGTNKNIRGGGNAHALRMCDLGALRDGIGRLHAVLAHKQLPFAPAQHARALPAVIPNLHNAAVALSQQLQKLIT